MLIGPLSIARSLAVASLAVSLAACSMGGGSSQLASGLSAPDTPSTASQPARLEAKVALLLPLSGAADAAAIGKGMKQAAELALFELNNPGFQLTVKDTKGTLEGATAAATAAVSEGTELILGPLYARSVTAVGAIARPAGTPVIAFSNDRRVAGNGVYLLSFMADEEVSRIVAFAAGRGKHSLAALVPENAYGELMTSAFQAASARSGSQIIAIEKYPVNTNGMLQPSERLFKRVKEQAAAGAPVDAIFLPGGPETLPNLAPLIRYANDGGGPVTFLGSGGWDYPNLGRNKNFIGSWYPAPDPRGWHAFSEKFARTFGSSPPRIAALAHDAVTVAINLATAQPRGSRYTAANLARPTGFSGIDGAFRFTADGTSQHSLAILEVRPFDASVIDPAPAGFDTTAAGRVNDRYVSTGTLSGFDRLRR